MLPRPDSADERSSFDRGPRSSLDLTLLRDKANSYASWRRLNGARGNCLQMSAKRPLLHHRAAITSHATN